MNVLFAPYTWSLRDPKHQATQAGSTSLLRQPHNSPATDKPPWDNAGSWRPQGELAVPLALASTYPPVHPSTQPALICLAPCQTLAHCRLSRPKSLRLYHHRLRIPLADGEEAGGGAMGTWTPLPAGALSLLSQSAPQPPAGQVPSREGGSTLKARTTGQLVVTSLIQTLTFN